MSPAGFLTPVWRVYAACMHACMHAQVCGIPIALSSVSEVRALALEKVSVSMWEWCNFLYSKIEEKRFPFYPLRSDGISKLALLQRNLILNSSWKNIMNSIICDSQFLSFSLTLLLLWLLLQGPCTRQIHQVSYSRSWKLFFIHLSVRLDFCQTIL